MKGNSFCFEVRGRGVQRISLIKLEGINEVTLATSHSLIWFIKSLTLKESA